MNEAHDGGVAAPRTVVLVAFDGIQLLDLAGPVEVFAAATGVARRAGRRGYRVRIATPGGSRIRSSSGIEVGSDLDLFSLDSLATEAPDVDTLLVVGGLGTREARRDDELLAAVQQVSGRARRTTSVCTGALVLAAAGLLDGFQATTHWASCDLLAERTEVEVLPDQIFVRDRDRWTSAGVTAGIDLALALVDDDLGPEVAHEVAAYLVVFARRPGGQAQFSVALRAQAARTPAIVEVQQWLPDNLGGDLTVERLAIRADMSPRTVGLRHAETLHRAFARRVGTTPARYRQHFSHSSHPPHLSAPSVAGRTR